MDDKVFINEYINRYKESLIDTDVSNNIINMKKMLIEIKK